MEKDLKEFIYELKELSIDPEVDMTGISELQNIFKKAANIIEEQDRALNQKIKEYER
jgi:hypothetical protein